VTALPFAAAVLSALVAFAQQTAAKQAAAPPERPRAQITATSPDAVAPGTSVTLTLRVLLPEGVHVQADRPRDPNLIATALTVDAPAGVTVERIVYPAPSDFVLAGQRAPLLVFGNDFRVEVRVAVAASGQAGPVRIPAQLRYQACNDRLCFAPARAQAEWTVVVTKP